MPIRSRIRAKIWSANCVRDSIPSRRLRADTRFVKAGTLKLPPADTYDIAILALFVRVSDRKGNVDVPPEQAALAEQIFHAGKPVITVGFGSPYLIENFPQAETWLGVFGISDVAQISVARALFGQIPIGGHLPVTIPGIDLKAGFGISRPADPMTVQPMDAAADKQLQPAYAVIEKAIADKAFPGATLAVGYKGRVAITRFWEAQLRRAGTGRDRADEIRHRFADQGGRHDDAGGETCRGRLCGSAGSGRARSIAIFRNGRRRHSRMRNKENGAAK